MQTRNDLVAAASALALLVGAFLMAAAVLRLGFLANFISDPVLTGFKAGIGLVIVVDQVPKLLGVHIERGHFFRKIFSILQHIPETSLPTLILGAAHDRNPARHETLSAAGPRSTRRRRAGCIGGVAFGSEARCRVDRSYSGGDSKSERFRT